MSRHVATSTQYRNLERMLQGLRRDMDRVALGEPGSVQDALKDIESIRQQLPIIERLVNELGSAPAEKFKPSIRPVDRLIESRLPPVFEPAPPIDDLERLLAQPGQGSPFS